jgi:cyclophilin family peptidyl-prolyl cis-trans isomerase
MTPVLVRRLTSFLAALAVAAIVLAACSATGSSPAGSSPPATTSTPAESVPAGSAPATNPSDGTASTACPTSQPDPLPAGETRTVTVKTDQGDFAIKVEADLSPIAAGNFVALAECGFYDGVVFHRLVPGFVIQGGDPTGTGTGGPGYTIKDEPVTAKYGRGTVAMARTPDPDSVGSQFFIVLDDAAEQGLARYNTYQIIGTVTSGMETVDAIAAMPNSGLPNNAAIDPVAMTSVTVSNP